MPSGISKTSTSKESLDYNDKLAEAMRMRRLGATYDEIAEKVGMKPKTIQKAISRLLETVLLDEARDLKVLQMVRLERLVAAITEKAENGNLFAVKTLLKVFDRQAKLCGLDSPVKTALTDTEGNDKPAAQTVIYLPDNQRDKQKK
jgi:DNA-binding transcriptional ArsR family regulator